MDRDALAERVRDSLPDFESVLIAVLCLGGFVILLDMVGIDVIENLRDSVRGDEPGYLLYIVAMGVLSYLVERFRDAFDEPHTADVPDPLGDRESEREGEDDEAEGEPATEQRTVEFARSRNDSPE
ncbi:hypothetical protein [Halococcus sp. IIIV-5B]|uniref:hypothetical protein n=1 Tax=Halococcus sp. IIIV-5B TaxID=2321230 RepID=UPI000E728116|nr:hypothetical protein [Halococcus sp. IIIV-5B]RJT07928.1 hypothetical protein D3261_00840 [Halococcus sp. IIIV-5B]